MTETETPVEVPKRYFTNSELKTFKRCRRKWWLSQHRGLRYNWESRVGPMAIGTRLHRVMETGFNSDWDAAFEELNENTNRDAELYPTDAAQIEKDSTLVRIMVEGYLEWTAEEGEDEDFVILAQEAKVEVPMPGMENVWLLGKLDQLVLKRSSNEVFFRDWKSVQDFSRVMLLVMDEQMMHYMLLLRLLANHPTLNLEQLSPEMREHAAKTVGGVYAMFRKVKRTGNAKPPFYKHTVVRHNELTLLAYFSRVWEEISDVLSVEAKLAAGADPHSVCYPNPTRDCSWDCDFRTVCPMFDDGSDAEYVLASQYEVRSYLERYDDEAKGDAE